MKYDIYLLLGDDGVYNSKFIETVDSLEQAEDRVAELRAENGCSAYYEEVLSESKNIEDIEAEYRKAIDRTFDIMQLYGKDNKYYRQALKKQKDLEKQLDNFKSEESNKVEIVEDATQASAVASGTNGQISVFGSDAGNKFIKHSSEDIYKELFELKDYDPEEEHNIYTCMDCGNEFEDSQVYIKDADGNPSCPFCRSGDVSKYED